MRVARLDQPHARVRADGHLADRADLDARARRRVCRQRLADRDPSFACHRLRSDPRLAAQARHLPRRALLRRLPRDPDHHRDRGRRGQRRREEPDAYI